MQWFKTNFAIAKHKNEKTKNTLKKYFFFAHFIQFSTTAKKILMHVFECLISFLKVYVTMHKQE